MIARRILLVVISILFFLFLGFSLSKKNPTMPVVSQNYSVLSSKTTPLQQIIQKDNTSIIDNVLDGDTIRTSGGEKIRYLGMNAPEIGEPFATEATEVNKEMVLGKKVKLIYDIQRYDKYGRTLAYVYTDNLFVNAAIVRKGFAVSQTIQPNVIKQDEILSAQKEARDSCTGMWQGVCEAQKATTKSCIQITAINADALGNDNTNKNDEWIELKNTCSRVENLNNWLLKDSSATNSYVFQNISIQAGMLARIYSGCGIDTKTSLFWKCPEEKYAVWNNLGDHAFLYNDRGELVSDYMY